LLVKIVSVFLVGMVVLAMFGRLRMPKPPRLIARNCHDCGRPRIGRDPCPCTRKKI